MSMQRLHVSANRRFLVHNDGTPFFWLGDTAWELFHRLDREEAAYYLDNRQAKGFSVVQAVILAERDGLRTPNPYGELPLVDEDPMRPNDAYFQHVDDVIRMAAERGIYVGLLPTWGDKYNLQWGEGPVIFDPCNAFAYGKFVGARYNDYTNVIWIMGGDRNEVHEGRDYAPVVRAMAAGVVSAYERNPLMTYHPRGWNCSADAFHYDDWLDFNMWQSSHGQTDTPIWEWIARTYDRIPTKPVFDGEPNYEDIPIGFKPERGYFRDYDVRKQAYRAVFAGGFGETYGHNSVWQMHKEGDEGILGATHTWKEALDRPGASQMIHLKNLMLSRPYFSRIPGQDALASDPGTGGKHIQATRCSDGTYIMVYTPVQQSFAARIDLLAGEEAKGWWYDPRTGEATEIGRFPAKGVRRFTPPADGPDWVLILDDAAKNFSAPGKVG